LPSGHGSQGIPDTEENPALQEIHTSPSCDELPAGQASQSPPTSELKPALQSKHLKKKQ
jgi:hypothetical protein